MRAIDLSGPTAAGKSDRMFASKASKENKTMGILDSCFGPRLSVEDIVKMLSLDGGIQSIGVKFGMNADDNYTSCNTTAILIGHLIRGEITAIKPARIEDIREGLSQQTVVCVNLKPDHWFTVVPLGRNSNSVVVLQSYQGLYNVGEWLNAHPNDGIMDTNIFLQYLNDILAGNAGAATLLFARNGNSTDALTITEDFSDGATIDLINKVSSFRWKV